MTKAFFDAFPGFIPEDETIGDLLRHTTVTRVTITGACVNGEGNPAIERDPARLAPAKENKLKPTIA